MFERKGKKRKKGHKLPEYQIDFSFLLTRRRGTFVRKNAKQKSEAANRKSERGKKRRPLLEKKDRGNESANARNKQNAGLGKEISAPKG